MRFACALSIAALASAILFAGPVSAAEPSFCYVGKAPDDATQPNAPSPWKYLDYAVSLVALRDACRHETHRDKATVLESIRDKGCSATSEMHIKVEGIFDKISVGDLPPGSELHTLAGAIESAQSDAQSEHHEFCSFMTDFRYPEFNGGRWCELRQILDPIYRRYDPEYRVSMPEPPVC